MDKFRRAILPVLVVVVLLAALIYRLASCAPGSTKNGSSPAVDNQAGVTASMTTPEATEPSSSPDAIVSPTAPYSDRDINSIYDSLGLSVVEIRDAGDVTMVHYYKPTGVAGEIISRFDWFDRSTGTRDLVFGWAYTDEFEIKADQSFTVLTTGLSHINGAQWFPVIFRSGYSDVDGAVQYTGSEEKYYAPLDKSFTVGTDRHECLTDITFNPEFMSLGFDVQPGYESEFYAAYKSIPKMTVENEAGYSTITLYKTILSEDFKTTAGKETSYCSSFTVACDGTDTIIQLKLNENAVSRYNVSTERSPESDLPYAVIEYTKAYFNYPSGW